MPSPSRPSPQAAGRAVLLIPHRGDVADGGALPSDSRRILAIVREADGPVQVRALGERWCLNTPVRGKLEPLRAKMTKFADCGRLTNRLTGGSPHVRDRPGGP